MTIAWNDESRALVERLGSHLVGLLDAAHSEALRLHSSELTIEHLLCAAMRDEDCAAHEVVCHAFADPDTIYEEALALAPGLLVVASASTLPFSPASVRALHSAHAKSRERNESVQTLRLATESFFAMTDSQRETLSALGFRDAALEEASPRSDWPEDAGSFFAQFDDVAKRAVSGSNRAAAALRAQTIGPAHILLGCLQADEPLATSLGLNFSRARLTLARDHEDPTPAEARELTLGPELTAFLRALPQGADSRAFLEALHGPATQDLGTLLQRHKVSPDLLQRSVEAFSDPA